MATTNGNAFQFKDIANVYQNSSVHCAAITDQENKIVFASQSFASAMGFELTELEGKEFFVLPDVTSTHPSFKAGELSYSSDHPLQGYVIQKNGSKALVDYECIPVYDTAAKQYVLTRISNLEAYNQYNKLSECKETLENILDNLASSIVVIDPELIVLKNNSTFIKTFELSTNHIDHLLLKNLQCSFWQNEDVLYRLKDNYDHQQYDFDTELDWTRDVGDNKSFKIVSRLIHKDEDGEGYKILLVITDITEEKANQTGRNQQIRHIMHELRNPLSNLALCVELLGDSTKENNQEDSAIFLAKAANSIERMKQLINELNEFKTTK
jgi:PAS domain-containing protein